MYNANIKKQFIEERNSMATYPKKYLENVFLKIAPIEEKLNKDASNFSFYDIIEMFKTLSSSSTNIINNFRSILLQYTNWCLSNNLVKDGQNHYSEFTIDYYHQCVNTLKTGQKIVSRSEVLNWVKKLDNPCGAVMILGVFEGLENSGLEDLSAMRIGDVDFDRGIVKTKSGRNVKISPELQQYIQLSDQSRVFYRSNDIRNYEQSFYEDGCVIKQPDRINRGAKGQWIDKQIRIMLNEMAGNEITRKSLYISGKIHYINQRSVELGIQGEEFYLKYNDEIVEQFGKKENFNLFLINYKGYLV